jgi:AraC-like DNA-binding protein/mannose-6-phosphate isomerase-like protein (cupin superfamily)
MQNSNEVLKLKRGYLKNDFEFFHLKDKKNMEFEFHYHDFNKIIIFISGKVTYQIEGKAYKLKPWNILFVGNNDIHKPVISPEEPYERIVIWINSKFLEAHNLDGSNLLNCFLLSSKQRLSLLKLDNRNIKVIKNNLSLLEETFNSNEFGSGILKNALFLQLLVYLNRLYIGFEISKADSDVEFDERIEKIIDYINKNLNEDLSLQNIAEKFYMNKYYLMHRFKECTSTTLHDYIVHKRINYAAALIRKGMGIGDACSECGFKDYSSFVRAFKNIFELSPKQYYKAMLKYEDI